jgi:predicted nuclease with TOPRIM domain
MLDTFQVYTELKDSLETIAAEKIAQIMGNMYQELSQTVTKTEFNELKEVVKDLAEAQQRTEKRVEELAQAQQRTEQRVEELAEAQKAIEARLARLETAVIQLAESQQRTEQRMDELAQAQKATEARLTRLETAVAQLAEAQQRTEQRMEKLAQAQQRTEQRVDELAEAQKASEARLTRLETTVAQLIEAQKASEVRLTRLETSVENLAKSQEKTEKTVRQLAKQMGGLSENFGGDIEDIAYMVLHTVLTRELGWQVDTLERVWHTWGTEPEEVNIFGTAMNPKEPNKTIWIVGEAKHNIAKKEVTKFIKQLERAKQHLKGEIFPVFFCYRAHPEVQKMLLEANIRLVFSYGKLI